MSVASRLPPARQQYGQRDHQRELGDEAHEVHGGDPSMRDPGKIGTPSPTPPGTGSWSAAWASWGGTNGSSVVRLATYSAIRIRWPGDRRLQEPGRAASTAAPP